MVIYGFLFYIYLKFLCYSKTEASWQQYRTFVEFILTNLFGYLIRTGCTGTPGTKAPMEVKRVAHKHLLLILMKNCSVQEFHLFSVWSHMLQNAVKSLSDTPLITPCSTYQVIAIWQVLKRTINDYKWSKHCPNDMTWM